MGEKGTVLAPLPSVKHQQIISNKMGSKKIVLTAFYYTFVSSGNNDHSVSRNVLVLSCL